MGIPCYDFPHNRFVIEKTQPRLVLQSGVYHYENHFYSEILPVIWMSAFKINEKDLLGKQTEKAVYT